MEFEGFQKEQLLKSMLAAYLLMNIVKRKTKKETNKPMRFDRYRRGFLTTLATSETPTILNCALSYSTPPYRQFAHNIHRITM